MTSIARPSRRVRESATAMRYCGLRIFPSRGSLIFTAMVKQFSYGCHAAIQRFGRDARIRFCLACVTAEQASRKRRVARRTAAYCARAGPEVRNPLRTGKEVENLAHATRAGLTRLLQDFLEALGLHAAGHPP